MNLTENKKISLSILLAFIVIANVLTMPILFGQSSTGATVFGQYSLRYAVMLLGAVFLTVFWGGVWVFRHKVESWNQEIPPLGRTMLMLFFKWQR